MTLTMKSLYSAVLLSFALFGLTAALTKDGKPLHYKIVQHNSKASAMMLGLADENTAFIMDKVENNRDRTNSGKPTWSSLVNLTDFSVTGLDATTNPFCAAGATLGNGSWIVVGGNKAVAYGGATPANGDTGPYAPYKDQDGRRVVRIMEPQQKSGDLAWIDNYDSPNRMDSERWYPGIEVLEDGSAVIIGGATSGGFVNRNYPNRDPAYASGNPNPKEGVWVQGGANPSFEFWPPTGKPKPRKSEFMVKTSGLNMYPHTYLMPSGKIFMQANYSTILWDPIKNKEESLPDMPGHIIRVYPASAATGMLPLTPESKYTPTILFCGGTQLHSDKAWGDYGGPNINMYEHPANAECHSITPENGDGSTPDKVQYIHEGDLPEGRSMGQFIHLPDGTMVIVNGAEKGVAGYGNTSWNMVQSVDGKEKVRFEGFAQDPTYRPVVYDPSRPKGKRLIYDGFGNSSIARLYHSSAILIPDGSVLVAGSNPHQDVAIDVPKKTKSKYQGYNTTYVLEQWYPKYYFEPRPPVNGVPRAIKFGGDSFNVTVPASYMGKSANDRARKTKIYVIRPGFSTHAMNMGQRSLQLENSYEVQDNGDVTFMVNPMPTNMRVFVAGPALFFVTVDGVPSLGKMVQIGGEDLKQVPFKITPGNEPAPLPKPVNNPKFNAKAANSLSASNSNTSSLSGGAIAGIVVGIVAGVVLLLLGLLFLLRYRRRPGPDSKYAALDHTKDMRPVQNPPYSNAMGAMPWANGTTESLRSGQTPDDSHMRIIPNNDSHVSLQSPSYSMDPYQQKNALGSYASLPASNSRPDVSMMSTQQLVPSQYTDQVPMNDMTTDAGHTSVAHTMYTAPSPNRTGVNLPATSEQQHSLTSAWPQDRSSAATPSEAGSNRNGPVLYPTQSQHPRSYQNTLPVNGGIMPSPTHGSHLSGPREMPGRPTLQNHLHASGQEIGNNRRI